MNSVSFIVVLFLLLIDLTLILLKILKTYSLNSVDNK